MHSTKDLPSTAGGDGRRMSHLVRGTGAPALSKHSCDLLSPPSNCHIGPWSRRNNAPGEEGDIARLGPVNMTARVPATLSIMPPPYLKTRKGGVPVWGLFQAKESAFG